MVDGYFALFRAFYAIRHPLYSPVTGEATQAILVFAQMLLKLYALAPDYVVVAWDAPGKTFRDALFAEYAQFAAPEPLSQQMPPVEIAASVPTTTDAASNPVAPAENETAPPATPAADAVVPPPVLLPPPPVSSYKGTRRETPGSLHEQTPRILELLELFGIPVIGKPGLEADDIIATLTDRVLTNPAQSDLRVRIVSRDKDLEQLINNRVTLFDVHTGIETGEADLWNKRGITPAQVIDFLSLTGDVVDNIPGVAGIGPKTAAKLLQQFGSIDALLNAAPNIPDKVRENLEQARPLLPVSRRLVTLEKNANIPFDWEAARTRPLPVDDLLKFCDALGFTTLKKQFLRHAPPSPVETTSED